MCEQKWKRCKQVEASPKRAMFSRLEVQPPRMVMSFYLPPLASSLEHVLRFPLSLHPFIFPALCLGRVFQVCIVYFTFLVPCWAVPLEYWQCLIYFPALRGYIVHDVCISIYACIWQYLFAPVWLSLLVWSLHVLLISFISFFAFLLACFLVYCMYMHEVRMLGVKPRPPRCEQKGQRRKPKKGNVQQVRALASPSGLCPSISYLKPLLQSMYQGSPSSSTLLFFLLLAWVAFPLYVIALCMMYVYLYLLVYG